MEFGWTALAVLVIAALVAWFWQDSLAARERANDAAIDMCERLGLQFLDGTVAFARLQFERGTNSLFTLKRTYVFDYTANSIERRQGFVVLRGRMIENVGYEREERRNAPTLEAPEKPLTREVSPPSNVLSLDEWRARQRSASQRETKDRQSGSGAAD